MKSENNEEPGVELLRCENWVSNVRVVDRLETDEFFLEIRVIERVEPEDPFLKKVEVVETVVDIVSGGTNPATWFKWVYKLFRWLRKKQA